MQTNRPLVFFGLILVGGGALLLAGNLFHFDAWAFCWPVVLIALGVWVMMRPAGRTGGLSTFRLIAEVTRSGNWQVVNEDSSYFVGEFKMDFSQAEMHNGETCLAFSGFVGEFSLLVPADVGLCLSSSALVSELRTSGDSRQGIFTPVELTTPGYAQAQRRLRIEFRHFVTDVKVRQV